ncbi:MAG: sensor domain-containing diguanylate cyclase, partial [Candidatus Eremiobacteraeota bacterium]|nr:sensor domain-containing diguanylate cyclase [Candidatus Eremiobacteraeota bacterium]
MNIMVAPKLPPFPDLASAAKATMQYLQQQFGLGTWLFNRVEGEDFVVLDAIGSSYPIAPGSIFAWNDTLCKPMVEGNGPMIAPRAMDVPAYAAAPAASVLPIESYVGIPIYRADG